MKIESLSVLVPVYNEEASVYSVLLKIHELELRGEISKEIVVINDASSDDTIGEIQRFIRDFPNAGIILESHEKNQGKGAALHTGIASCSGDYAIVQDADLEYDPEEINDLLKPILKGKADVVYGSRFISGGPHRVLFYWHYLGNKFLTTLSNMFTDLNLTDMETCYKLIPTQVLKSLDLEQMRFGFEPEVTAKLAQVPNLRIYEIGISYYGRTYEEGKKIGWKDGFEALFCIVRYSLFAQLKSWPAIKRVEYLLRSMSFRTVFIVTFGIGVFLRLRQFFFRRSFWLDEAFLANNIRDRDFVGLLQPLEYSQVAPIGFLYFEKLMFLTFGPSELSLRLFPLLTGTLSILLIYQLGKSIFNREVGLYAMIIFAFSFWPVHYSVELKQYSSDVFFCLLVFYLYTRFERSPSPRRSAVLGLVGLLSIWFSNVAPISLFCIGLIWLTQIGHYDFRKFIQLSLVWITPILVGFVIYYINFIHAHPARGQMQEYWQFSFMPEGALFIPWASDRIYHYIRGALNFHSPSSYIFLATLFFSIIYSAVRGKGRYVLLILPLIIQLILSAFKLYPFDTRLILYTFAGWMLFAGLGVYITDKVLDSRIFTTIVMIFICFGSFSVGLAEQLVRPRQNEHLRPVMQEVAKSDLEFDRLYVHSSCEPAFRYYLPLIFNDSVSPKIVWGERMDVQSRFENQLSELSGKSWIFFSHGFPPKGINMIDSLVRAQKLEVIDSVYRTEARAYLVDIPSQGLLIKQ